MPLPPGTRLGPYEVVSAIGAGGMGEVYRGRDSRLDRTVAIKVLPAHIADAPELRERFEREARAISSLNHPHICTLYDVGREQGLDFLVMEFLNGESLADRLARGPLPLDQVLRHAVAIADALDRAHRQGIVHRDLKPANVFLVARGGPSPLTSPSAPDVPREGRRRHDGGHEWAKLLDFGLAKPLSSPLVDSGGTLAATPTASQPLTARGSILGTVQYMAPEQIEGREADVQSDVFALGLVIYEMATGRRAFEGGTPASVMAAILERDPPPVSAVRPLAPPALDHVVRTCLAKDPDDRWQSAGDVARALRGVVTTGEPAGTTAHPPATRRRERIAWGLAALLATAASILLLTRPAAPPAGHAVRFAIPPPEQTAYIDTFAISPDGRRIAFVAADTDGTRRLWVRPLEALGARPLRGTEQAVQPFWSAHGTTIGFFAGGRLKRVPADGGDVTTISEAGDGGGGTWSQDDVVLFAPFLEGPLFQVSAFGGQPVPATALQPDQEEIHHLWPAFLPDGTHYAFLVQARGGGGIYLGRLDSPERRLLVPLEEGERTAVHYGSGHLFYVRRRALFAHPFDAARLQLIGEPVQVAEEVEVAGPGRSAFAVSAAGVIGYRMAEAVIHKSLVWLDRAGSELGQAGPPGPYGVRPDAAALSPDLALSPDGRWLAAIREEPAQHPSIWLIDLARGTSSRLTSPRHWAVFPVWAPDGREVAFSMARDTPPNVYRQAVGGASAEERVTPPSLQQNYVTDWSRDGRIIVYDVADPTTGLDIWTVPASGDDRTPAPYLRTDANESQGRLSPDGRWMAYMSDESGRQEIYVARFPDPDERWPISTGGGFYPRWRRDGRELYYVAPGGAVMAVPVRSESRFEAGAPVQLFHVPPRSAGDVSPDGERFLVARPEGEMPAPPLTLVLNWAPDR